MDPGRSSTSPQWVAAVRAGVPGLRDGRQDVRTGLTLALALAVFGLLAGLVWLWLAPRAEFRVTSVSGGIEPVGGGMVSPELFMSDDGVYVLVLGGLGLLGGIAGWLLRAHRGVILLASLAGGMVLASVAAWLVGALVGHGPSEAQVTTVGTVVTTGLNLNALAALAVGPFVAVLIYLVATVVTAHDDLGRTANSG